MRQSCGSGQKEGEGYLEDGGGADAPALLVMLAVAGLPVCDRRGRRTSQLSSTICSLLPPRCPHFTLPASSSTTGFNPAPLRQKLPSVNFPHPVLPARCSLPSFSRPLLHPNGKPPLGGLSPTWRLCPVLDPAGEDSPPRLVFLQPAAKLS